MAKYDCLIVDDEEVLSLNTCEYFNMFGLKTIWVKDKKGVYSFFTSNSTDLILLDINLGEASGFEICKILRKTTDAPILFISARRSDDDVLLALNVGGDDYIQKPYSLSVLLAKAKAVLKRYRGKVESSISFGDFTIDINKEKLFKKGSEIKLKTLEFKLLAYFIQNRNRIISKDELFVHVWQDDFTTDGTLNVHIRKLREKIEENPNEPRFIKTIWGTGYMFEL